MKNDKKLVRDITSMNEDFAKWYTDICKKADLVDYSSVKGCMVIRPYGYAIWENIQKILDAKFKENGVENVYMPITRIFLFLAFFGSLGRLDIISRSVCVSSTLLSKTGSMNGLMSAAVPHEAFCQVLF